MGALTELTWLVISIRILMSVCVGGLLGIERGRKNRPAGMRTYMLVCLGAAIVMMTNQYVVQQTGAGDPVRMGAQVISGIGFLGAGSIMVTGRNQIRGITTAAGLWTAGCVGLAIGIGFYEVAILGGLTVFFIFTLLHNLDYIIRKKSKIIDLYVELEGPSALCDFLAKARSSGLEMNNLELEHDNTVLGNTVAFIVTVKGRTSHAEILQTVRGLPHLRFIQEI